MDPEIWLKLEELPLLTRLAYIRLFSYKLEKVTFSVRGFLDAIGENSAVDIELCKLLADNKDIDQVTPIMLDQLCFVYGLGDDLASLNALWDSLGKLYSCQWFHLTPYSEQEFMIKMWTDFEAKGYANDQRKRYYATYRNKDRLHLTTIALQYSSTKDGEVPCWNFVAQNWDQYDREKDVGRSVIKRMFDLLDDHDFFDSEHSIPFNR